MSSPDPDWRELLTREPLPTDLAIRYSSLHPYHGGHAFELLADGTLTRYSMERGGEVESETSRVESRDVERIARLAAELELWRQQTPERQAEVDESRAEAQITAEGHKVETWEWFNDLEANGRLARLAEGLRAL